MTVLVGKTENSTGFIGVHLREDASTRKFTWNSGLQVSRSPIPDNPRASKRRCFRIRHSPIMTLYRFDSSISLSRQRPERSTSRIRTREPAGQLVPPGRLFPRRETQTLRPRTHGHRHVDHSPQKLRRITDIGRDGEGLCMYCR